MGAEEGGVTGDWVARLRDAGCERLAVASRRGERIRGTGWDGQPVEPASMPEIRRAFWESFGGPALRLLDDDRALAAVQHAAETGQVEVVLWLWAPRQRRVEVRAACLDGGRRLVPLLWTGWCADDPGNWEARYRIVEPGRNLDTHLYAAQLSSAVALALEV